MSDHNRVPLEAIVCVQVCRDYTLLWEPEEFYSRLQDVHLPGWKSHSQEEEARETLPCSFHGQHSGCWQWSWWWILWRCLLGGPQKDPHEVVFPIVCSDENKGFCLIMIPLYYWWLILPIQNNAKKLIKWLKLWHMGTLTRVLIKSYLINTNMTGLRYW